GARILRVLEFERIAQLVKTLRVEGLRGEIALAPITRRDIRPAHARLELAVARHELELDPGTGTPMVVESRLCHMRAMAMGAVSVAPRPVRNMMRSPQVASASACISSNTDCDSAAPANHSTLSLLKKVLRSRSSARR